MHIYNNILGESKHIFCKDCFIFEIKCTLAISYLKLEIKKNQEVV